MARGRMTMSEPVNGPNVFRLFTDFLAPIGSNGTGDLVGVSSGGTVLALAGERGHPGIRQMSTSTSATGQTNVGTVGSAILLGDGPLSMCALGRIPTLSTAAQRFQCYCGLFDSVSAAPNNGVFFLYADNINGGNWQLNVIVGGVQVAVDTGIPPVANTWQKLSLTLSNVGVAGASINGVGVSLAGLSGVTLPTAALTMGLNLRKTVGATARTWDADYLGWEYQLNRS